MYESSKDVFDKIKTIIPGLTALIFKSKPFWSTDFDPEQCAKTIIGDIEFFITQVDRNSDKELAVNPFQLHALMEMTIVASMILTYLSSISLYKNENDKEMIWDSNRKNKVNSSLVFHILCNNLSNTLLSIRKLIYSGFDGQARILFRNFAETSEILLAISLDKGTFDQYVVCCENDNDNFNIWNKHLKPSVIRHIIKSKCRSLKIPVSLLKKIEKDRQSTYKWLSRFTHTDWGAQVVTCHAFDRNIGGDCCINFAGDASSASNSTLLSLTAYLSDFFLLLERILVDKHNLICEKYSEKWYFYMSAIYQALYLSLHKHIDDFVNNEE